MVCDSGGRNDFPIRFVRAAAGTNRHAPSHCHCAAGNQMGAPHQQPNPVGLAMILRHHIFDCRAAAGEQVAVCSLPRPPEPSRLLSHVSMAR
jgi:hypothetical protein